MLIGELRSAARRLLRQPGSSALAIAVLGLGLGTALFLLGVVNGLILQPLPFPDAERLVAIGGAREGDNGVGGLNTNDFLLLKQHLRSFDQMGTYEESTANISRGGGALPKRYSGSLMSAETQQLVGVQPILGRGISSADDLPGAPLVLLLGEQVWRNDFGADPAVLGQVLKLNGEPATVVGVLPAEFRFPFTGEVWQPRRMRGDDPFGAQVIARLAPGVSIAEARAELEAVSARLGTALLGVRDARPPVLKPLSMRFVNEMTRSYVWMMFAPGLLVLLLACINVANLRLGNALARRHELAIRGALGASRARLLRELLAESLLLSLLATAIGLVLAHLGGEWLLQVFIANEDAPAYYVRLGVDARMLGFGLAAALITTLLAGLLPALRASRLDVQQGLREGGRSGSDASGGRALQALVVVEIALTVVLLVGAGTFVRGLDRVFGFDFGTQTPPAEILTGRIGLPSSHYADAAARLQFFARLVESLEADPRVVAASVASALPGTMAGAAESVAAVGQMQPPEGYPRALAAHVDPGFAEVYGLQLLSGRLLDPRDVDGSERVVVVDARMAETLWPGRDALGQTLLINPQRTQPDPYTVVGVVANLHLEDADDPVQPSLLAPLAQHPREFVTVAVHTRGDALALAPLLAESVRALDPDMPVYWLRTQQRAIEMGRIGPLILTQLFSGVGLIGLVLAAAGLYGVLAHAVTQRSREIGIRRAIGADARSVLRLVGGGVALQLGIGLTLGIALALPWSTLIATPAMHTRAQELDVFALSVLVVVLAALAACFAPLRRALQLDPNRVLKSE
jgi:putative ABC transport system permease protein